MLEKHAGRHGEDAYLSRKRLVSMAWERISSEKTLRDLPSYKFFAKQKQNFINVGSFFAKFWNVAFMRNLRLEASLIHGFYSRTIFMDITNG